jgi:hypothetical protein
VDLTKLVGDQSRDSALTWGMEVRFLTQSWVLLEILSMPWRWDLELDAYCFLIFYILWIDRMRRRCSVLIPTAPQRGRCAWRLQRGRGGLKCGKGFSKKFPSKLCGLLHDSMRSMRKVLLDGGLLQAEAGMSKRMSYGKIYCPDVLFVWTLADVVRTFTNVSVYPADAILLADGFNRPRW